MPTSVMSHVAIYQETYEQLVNLVGDSGLLPEHLVEELVNYDWHSLFSHGGRATGKDRDPAARSIFVLKHIPMRYQTHKHFLELLSTHNYSSQDLIRLAVKYYTLAVGYGYSSGAKEVKIYESTFKVLEDLASEDGILPETELQRFIHNEYLLRYSTFENPKPRPAKYPNGRREPPRDVPKVSVFIGDKMWEELQILLHEDGLGSEEFLADTVGYQDISRHVHFRKEVGRFLGFKCGRKNCFITY